MHIRFAISVMLLGVFIPFAPSMGQPVSSTSDDERLLNEAKIGTDGPALLAFFRGHLFADGDRERIQRLITQLGDEDFETRETARAEVLRVGPKAIALLEPVANGRNKEVAARAADCIRHLETGAKGRSAASGSLMMAAARVLAVRKPAGTAEVLLDFVAVADDDTGEEIRAALVGLAAPDGKPEPALVKALTSSESARRGVAGATFAKADVPEMRIAVRKLLRDPEHEVRLRVGLALAGAKDKDAITPLIDLLAKLPPERAWPIDELLQRLAGEKTPHVYLGDDDAGKVKCRDAWAAWWRDHGAAVKMTVLDGPRPQIGYTQIAVADQSSIREVDRDGKLRWEITGLRSPHSFQVLPQGRVLIAEYGGIVTERNLKGEVLWQKGVFNAMQCQRLRNGKTFVVSTDQILEFDLQGRDHALYTHKGRAFGTSLVAAKKLPTGRIIAIDSSGNCMKLDSTGKELSRFAVGSITNNCLDVLPNGHVVVPNFIDGKVKEYDGTGKVVWQIEVGSPISAQRLPNGNTLVACHQPGRIVEVDRAGKVVWEHKLASPTDRPWFASRR